MDNYSVLMTLYSKDNPQYARISIDSIISQTYRTNDFLLVCDGDLSQELNLLIDEYTKEHSFIRVIRLQNNVGLGAALRIGLPLCKNDLVARMDDDDISTLDRCETEVKFLMHHPEVAIVGSSVIEFQTSPNEPIRIKKVPITHSQIIKFSRRRNPFNHSTIMFRKSKVLEAGNYSELRTNQDIELWVRLLHNGITGANLDKPLVYFRFNSDTYRRRKSWKNAILLIDIWKVFYFKKYCTLFDFMHVACVQIVICILPIFILRLLYTRFR
jgi:glycosyltransferase involved in cell wall biosynthesis